MTTSLPSTQPGSETLSPRLVCPLCAAQLRLTWPRPVDRLARRVVPSHRYRCQSPSCPWEGNRRADSLLVVADPPARDARPGTAPSNWVLATGVALVTVLITSTAWSPTDAPKAQPHKAGDAAGSITSAGLGNASQVHTSNLDAGANVPVGLLLHRPLP